MTAPLSLHEAVQAVLEIVLPPDDGYAYCLTAEEIKRFRAKHDALQAAYDAELAREQRESEWQEGKAVGEVIDTVTLDDMVPERSGLSVNDQVAIDMAWDREAKASR